MPTADATLFGHLREVFCRAIIERVWRVCLDQRTGLRDGGRLGRARPMCFGPSLDQISLLPAVRSRATSRGRRTSAGGARRRTLQAHRCRRTGGHDQRPGMTVNSNESLFERSGALVRDASTASGRHLLPMQYLLPSKDVAFAGFPSSKKTTPHLSRPSELAGTEARKGLVTQASKS